MWGREQETMRRRVGEGAGNRRCWSCCRRNRNQQPVYTQGTSSRRVPAATGYQGTSSHRVPGYQQPVSTKGTICLSPHRVPGASRHHVLQTAGLLPLARCGDSLVSDAQTLRNTLSRVPVSTAGEQVHTELWLCVEGCEGCEARGYF